MMVLRGVLLAFMLTAADGGDVERDEQYPSPSNLITREEWGAKPAKRPYDKHTIVRITVHHQGVKASYRQDVPRRLKNMQAFHQSEDRGFADIAYHFIIDRKGRLYEGRPTTAPGESKTDYDPKGHLLICLLGDFEVQEPTHRQMVTLKRVLLWGLETYGLTADVIRGHRDHAHSECPGKYLYRQLPKLRRQLAKAHPSSQS